MATQGPDIINGTGGDDIINGKGGDDVIHGLGGDDQINGGSDNDTIYGDEGDDQISGGSGNDALYGGTGNDILIGGSGEDTAYINADGANGIGSHNGGVLTVTSVDGQDQLTQIEHIHFNNGTVDIINGNAHAYLGADSISIDQAGTDGGNALTNDFDIDDTMTLTGFISNFTSDAGSIGGGGLHGQYGSLSLNADGSYSYTADASTNSLGVGESVSDVFTYTVNSGGTNSTQTITIVINGLNDDPSIDSAVDSATYNDTLANDSFPDHTGTLAASDPDTNDTLTFGATGAAADVSHVGYDMSVVGLYGKLYINSATGAYDYVANDAAMEHLKTTVSESFTFTVDDGHSGQDTQSFTVTVNGVNDKPTLNAIPGMTYTDTAADDTFNTQSGTLHGGDRDRDTLTAHVTGETVDGSQSGFNHSVAGTYGTLYFNDTTGAYEYIPNDGAIEGLKTTASDTFSFTVTDGSLTSNAQILTVTLNGANDNPDIGVTGPSNDVTEQGSGPAAPGTATGTFTLTDRDTADTPTFDTAALGAHGWSDQGGGIWLKVGTYGAASLDTATGIVTYTLDDGDSDTQGLQTGDTVQDSFTVYATDGTGGTNSAGIDFTIHGTNDAAVVGGVTSGSATEASGVANGTAGSNATGTATDTDVDNNPNTFQAVATPQFSDNSYGTWTVTAGGDWVFNVAENDATVQALNVGQSLTDTFTIHTQDGTAQIITITIQGANDAAVITGSTSSSVTESDGVSGSPNASGQAFSADVDNDSLFQAVSATATDLGYGTYTVDASGNWTFTLDDSNLTVQAQNDGDVLTETFTILTTDGTEQVITISINGSNEVSTGTGGNDFMTGTIYGDTMSGLAGNDTYVINNTADKIVENVNDGQDTAQTSVDYTLGANVEDLLMSGHGSINGTGNGLDNLIVGNSGANVLSGAGGDDVIRGGSGADTLLGGTGDDNMDGGLGVDTASYAGASGPVTVSLALSGFQDTVNDGFDKLANIENLTGSAFGDSLTGSSVKNAITGGGAADTLAGGGGSDTFVYTAASDSAFGGADTITDLANSEHIDLSAIATDFTIVGSFTGAAHQITLSYNGGTHITTIAIDMNGDGDASDAGDMQILVNGDHHTFTNFIGV